VDYLRPGRGNEFIATAHIIRAGSKVTVARLDGVITKIKRVMQNALAKIQKTLMQPEVKKAGKEQIKEKARESIREKLAKGRLNADRDNRERWEREGRIAPKKKHDMEL
jgi:phosphoglycolate phosphatase-like HAD superfamily hydrolase